MRTVYTVAFSGPEFLMVYNQKRKGWEMPGGSIEDGETAEEAAVREYAEESGYEISVVSTMDIGSCHVYAAVLGKKIHNGEMASGSFSELPDELAFDRSEYDNVMEWARNAVK